MKDLIIYIASRKKGTATAKARPRHVGTQGRLIIWCPFKPIFFIYLFNTDLVGAGRN
jgi:hypothetical protein